MGRVRKILIIAVLSSVLAAGSVAIHNIKSAIDDFSRQLHSLSLKEKKVEVSVEYSKDKTAAKRIVQLREQQKDIQKALTELSLEQQQILKSEKVLEELEPEVYREVDNLNSYWPQRFNYFDEENKSIANLIEKLRTETDEHKIEGLIYLIETTLQENKDECSILKRQAQDNLGKFLQAMTPLLQSITEANKLKDPSSKQFQGRLRQLETEMEELTAALVAIPIRLKNQERNLEILAAEFLTLKKTKSL